MYSELISVIRKLHGIPEGFIPLHAPRMGEAEKHRINRVIDSGYVSSVGKEVTEFEKKIADFCGARYAVATSNGTSALHVALILAGVQPGDLVIMQSLSFVATANAASYCGATPVFLDVDRNTLGLSPKAVEAFLRDETEEKNGNRIHIKTGRRIAACVPMHSFGFPVDIETMVDVCDRYQIPLIEDAAESLGSYVKGKHTGTFGLMGTLSFNGNKIITGGNGGALITDDEHISRRAKHLTTTAKLPHPYEYRHDETGFNYRLPNLNAAFLLAQLDRLPAFLDDKRNLAQAYAAEISGFDIFAERPGTTANYWLNVMITRDREERDAILKVTNENDIMTRPAWEPLHTLPMFQGALQGDLTDTYYLADRIVNLPSSVRI